MLPAHPSPARRGARRSIVAAALGVAAAASFVPVTADARDDDSDWMAKLDSDVARALSEQGLDADGDELSDARGPSSTHRVIVNVASDDSDAVDHTVLDGRIEVITAYQTIDAFSADVDAAGLEALARRDDVTYIEAMPVVQRMDAEALGLTGGDQAHAADFRGAGATIAVIDDGIDTGHPAFGGDASFPNTKVIGGADFGDFDSDPRIDCTGQFHGTPVSSIAAGDGGGVTGAAPDAELVHVKVQSARNCGSSGLDGDIVGAMDWVVANQADFDIDVMSMSLGSAQSFGSSCDGFDRASAAVADEAVRRGIVVVAASGNGAEKEAMSWPACLSSVVSVGSVYDSNIGSQAFQICSDPFTESDLVTCYTNSSAELDLLAPSEAATAARAGGGLTSFGGTSSATPFAAGVFAVLAAADPSATPAELVDIVTATGVDVQDPANGRVTPRVDFVGSLIELMT